MDGSMRTTRTKRKKSEESDMATSSPSPSGPRRRRRTHPRRHGVVGRVRGDPVRALPVELFPGRVHGNEHEDRHDRHGEEQLDAELRDANERERVDARGRDELLVRNLEDVEHPSEHRVFQRSRGVRQRRRAVRLRRGRREGGRGGRRRGRAEEGVERGARSGDKSSSFRKKKVKSARGRRLDGISPGCGAVFARRISARPCGSSRTAAARARRAR